MKLAANPVVHEIPTWVWLNDLAARFGRSVTLGTVPDEVWDDVAGAGIDAVWLVGVWTRSAVAADLARADPQLSADHRAALADLVDDDVVGSAYSVRDFSVDQRLGGDAELAMARTALAARGVGLVLDFVPNHLAPDHPWTSEHPEYFIAGSVDELRTDPASFLTVGTTNAIVARGRNPHFLPWPDVIQLDTSSPAVRHAATDVLMSIADRCDGVRCSMAMLALDDVFVATWGERARGGAMPDRGRGYWPTVISAVREQHPDFAFWAEGYWERESTLIEQGFDACYDKVLYDRLLYGDPASRIREHLRGGHAQQALTVRFAENHDEPRLAAALGPEAARAVALVSLTLPGVALLHEGQEAARRVHAPPTLGRRPVEEPDAACANWYGKVRAALAGGLRRGMWSTVSIDGWADNRSCDHLVAWAWSGADARHLVVVNLSDEVADGRIRLAGVGGGPVILRDLLTDECYLRDGETAGSDGLYVELPPWGAHVLRW